MTSKTNKDLGRVSYEAYVGLSYVGPDNPKQGSQYGRRTIALPFQVQYSPYSVPGWKYNIAHNASATTTLIGNKPKMERVSNYRGTQIRSGLGYTYSWVYGGELVATMPGLPPTTGSLLPKAAALAAETFVSDYYAKTRSLRGASSIAEAASTIRGLASPAKALRKEVGNLYNSLRKRLWRSDGYAVKDARNVISGTWLEWNFGIKPLVSDVNDGANAVNRMRDGDFRARVQIFGSGNDKEMLSVTPNQGVPSAATLQGVTIPDPGAIGLTDVYEYYTCDVNQKGSINVAPPGSEVPLAMQFGVGFDDILPAVWEGIPWSFFVDYFVNVSSVIDSWSSLSSRLAWANRTVRNGRVRMCTDLRPPQNSTSGQTSTIYTVSGGGFLASNYLVYRTPAAASDLMPPMRIKIPNTGTKWANIAALAGMARRPGPPPEWVGRRRRFR